MTAPTTEYHGCARCGAIVAFENYGGPMLKPPVYCSDVCRREHKRIVY